MSFESEVDFCLNFLKSVGLKKPSVFSPSSILNGLALVFLGANNKTAEEIAKVIGKNKTREQIIDYYSKFMEKHKNLYMLTTKSSTTTRKRKATEEDQSSKFVVVNQLFISNKVEPLKTFNDEMKEKFEGQIQQVNFCDNTAMEIINNFVNESTNGKIKKIISQIESETSIMLVNAVYFISNWSSPFNPRHKAMFYSEPPRKMDMMTGNLYDLNFTEGETWKAVGIPYRSRKTYMFVVLPNEKNGLNDLIESMDFSMFMKCTEYNFIDEKIDVTMPVFDISAEYDLKNTLQNLGIHDIFENGADLSRMFDQDHKINKAVHKATINVDEKGTEASAVTLCGAMPMNASPPEKFIVDHPFLYFIVLMEECKEVKKDEKVDEDRESESEPDSMDSSSYEDMKKSPKDILFAGIYS